MFNITGKLINAISEAQEKTNLSEKHEEVEISQFEPQSFRFTEQISGLMEMPAIEISSGNSLLGGLVSGEEISIEPISGFQVTAPQKASKIYPPVLQLNIAPVGIDISEFENPHSASNPNGSYLSLYNLSELANLAPKCTKYYFPGSSKIDSIYDNIIHGASVKPDATFTMSAIMNSHHNYEIHKLAGISGIPKSWLPVYASPNNWFEQIKDKSKLFSTEIDLSVPEDSFNGQFTIIGDQNSQNMDWNKFDKMGNISASPLNKKSDLNKIRFKFLIVNLNRPWFDQNIFSMNGWYLGGEKAGFISNGDIVDNDGILPLYPTSFILVTDLEIIGNLDKTDNNFLTKLFNSNKLVSLGPFTISSLFRDEEAKTDVMKNDGYFILAWISEVVKQAPKIEA